MSTKLKTLKDLEKIKLLAHRQPKECAGELAIEIRKLKAEAVKWVKENLNYLSKGVFLGIKQLKSDSKKDYVESVAVFDEELIQNNNDYKLIGMITQSVAFNNLTEEDLEEKSIKWSVDTRT